MLNPLRITTLLALCAALVASACGNGDPPPSTPDAVSDTTTDAVFSDAWTALVGPLNESCGLCHGSINGPCTQKKSCFIDEPSVMAQAPVSTENCGTAETFAICSVLRMKDGSMPPLGMAGAPPETIEALEAWIDAGMP